MYISLKIDLLSLLSLSIALLSAGTSTTMFIINVIHDRRRDTLDAFSVLQKEVFDKLNQYSPIEIKEIATKPMSTEYKTISEDIDRLEHFCVGVNQKIYDFTTVYV